MTPQKEKALAALLTSPNREQAARAAGITPRTMYNFFKDEEFCKRYRQAFKSLLEDSTRSAQQAITPALETLKEVLEDPEQPGGTRIQASKIVIDSALKMTDMTDVLDIVKKMEKMMDSESRQKLY